MKKYDLKERWELTDEERKGIYEYAMKRSDEIVKGIKRVVQEEKSTKDRNRET